MDAETRAYGPEKRRLMAEILGQGHDLHLQVLGASMLPSLWPHDVLKIERQDCNQIATGDVVLVQQDGRFFVHRVVAKEVAGTRFRFLTRGDCMPQMDPPVWPEDVLGRISQVHRRRGVRILRRRVSPLAKLMGRLLCYCAPLRKGALRIHARLQWPGSGKKYG